MNFFMIHENAQISAINLPDYAILNVNVREGWQMLCDMGHIVGVFWNTQNKLYSASHPNTRMHIQDKEMFDRFISHYLACCQEYQIRTGKINKIIKNFYDFHKEEIHLKIKDKLPIISDFYQSQIHYLINNKSDKITRACKGSHIKAGEQIKRLHDLKYGLYCK